MNQKQEEKDRYIRVPILVQLVSEENTENFYEKNLTNRSVPTQSNMAQANSSLGGISPNGSMPTKPKKVQADSSTLRGKSPNGRILIAAQKGYEEIAQLGEANLQMAACQQQPRKGMSR